MQYFGQYRNQTIHSLLRLPLEGAESMIKSSTIGTLERVTDNQVLALATANGVSVSDLEMRDQFLLFQFNSKTEGPTILDTSEVEPAKAGSAEQPDALVEVQLASFSVGSAEGIDSNTRATLRLDLGKDSNSDSPMDTVFWSIAAGMNLYNQIKNKPTEAPDLKADFNQAFSKRPVEIPGSLARFSFEVVKHKEPAWWKKIFSFLQTGAGNALTSAVGFPAITGQAIGLLDELVNRLDSSQPKVLFKGRPMTLALTAQAQDSFSAGVPSVNVGVMNAGFCLLARGSDYGRIIENNPEYMGAYGRLKPKDMDLQQFLQSPSDNPFNEMTYAILKVKTKETMLNPTLESGR